MYREGHCSHFQSLPLSVLITYTMTLLVLGTGYAFGMIHVFSSHAGRDGDPGLSVTDLMVAYSGSASDTRLEAALKGPMQKMLPDGERNVIAAWVRDQANEPEYEVAVAPIIAKRCIACHDGSNPHVPSLNTYEETLQLVEVDTGMDIFTLVRVSHIHLFGLTFIFFITSSIFCHAYMRHIWIKCLVIAIPFAAITADIASWYLTKVFTGFAWIVLLSGIFMGASFAIQWAVSMYQMWWYRLPPEIRERGSMLPGASQGAEIRE
ncbi:MAG: hypothetical protein ABFS23_03635 [Pseudomonadota bacterium]